MRVMVIMKADETSEAREGSVPPDEEVIGAMLKYNEELVKAGVMLAAEGLAPSSKGKRVKFFGKTTVIDGPFTEAKELIAGFWLWQVKSMEEAVEWVKRMPIPPESKTEIEIREVAELADFEITPELKQQERRLRAQAEANSKR